MAVGHDWFAEQMQLYVSRLVTYRGFRDGTERTAQIVVGIGTSQPASIDSLGTEQGLAEMTLVNPSEVDRDYIVVASDLNSSGLWSPQSGDFVDDTNDEEGRIHRYQVKGVPGQQPWRWLTGSYHKMARIHSKHYSLVETYWSDSFTGTDGALLSAHTPEFGLGGYFGGAGTISILDDAIVANAGESYRYFSPGVVTTNTVITFSFNLEPDDLDGEFAEVGVAVRCDLTGTGRLDGVYCTLKVGYTGDVQTTRQLRMVRRRNDANTTVAQANVVAEIDLEATYRLVVTNREDGTTLILTDDTGSVTVASTDVDSTLLNDFTGQAVLFDHTIADPTAPWIGSLLVEAAA